MCHCPWQVFFTVVRRSKPIFNITPVDEWGDEGKWETLVDFKSKRWQRGESVWKSFANLKR